MPISDRKALSIPCHVFPANSEKWTFQDKTVRAWVEERLSGRVLNACAGETALRHTGEIVRNDINEDRPADYHRDVTELPDVLGTDTFDTIVYDPPWSVFQVNDKYEGRGQDTIKRSTLMARALDQLLKPGGHILSFGYTVDMMPSSMNYNIAEVAVFTIPGPGRDFFGVKHRTENQPLNAFRVDDA